MRHVSAPRNILSHASFVSLSTLSLPSRILWLSPLARNTVVLPQIREGKSIHGGGFVHSRTIPLPLRVHARAFISACTREIRSRGRVVVVVIEGLRSILLIGVGIIYRVAVGRSMNEIRDNVFRKEFNHDSRRSFTSFVKSSFSPINFKIQSIDRAKLSATTFSFLFLNNPTSSRKVGKNID